MAMTLKEAFDMWTENCRPEIERAYGADDAVALAEGWNDYTDALCEDGDLTGLQYHYCPACDEPMPDDDADFVLDAMGVELHCRRAALQWREGWEDHARHFECVVLRGGKAVFPEPVLFSQGSAWRTNPKREDVLRCIIEDAMGADEAGDFETWAENLGFDTDLRKAKATHRECLAQHEALSAHFSEAELQDLRQLLEE